MSNSAGKFSLKPFFWPVVAGLLLAAVFLQSQQLRNTNKQLAGLQNLPSLADSPSGQATLNASDSYADAVAKAIPSVVNIYTARVVQTQRHPLFNDPVFRRFFGDRPLQQTSKISHGLGSGVIVSQNGHILTNHHVISKADRIRVMLQDGRERDATILGSDVATDIAVLKVELEDLDPAEFAAHDSARIGDVVLAIGNPYGIGQTVTQGIVSAIGRHGINLNTYESYIQTDAAINKGNSGGALINTSGKLVGINSGMYSQTGGSNGIGFAIPNDIAQYVLQQIVDSGEVVRGWLGISGEELTPSKAEYFGFEIQRGLLVTSLATDGPAHNAGLQRGDVITHIDGEKIGSGNASMHKIAQSAPGKTVNVSIFRKGASQNVLVTVGKKPEERSS